MEMSWLEARRDEGLHFSVGGKRGKRVEVNDVKTQSGAVFSPSCIAWNMSGKKIMCLFLVANLEDKTFFMLSIIIGWRFAHHDLVSIF
ncbi:hypothetical protein J5N97_008483 [Dioscorea zingiberensis]|uniref:Uncharacterized protein n=1 Tax=Dioscorea zingiberensis TaxID=325984 RepID=A0A9D5CXJ8_9LILI|nr:hypothetical protein J5N97_008483 [Dioscorea zingiberensis]